jgi:hypothetical protein
MELVTCVAPGIGASLHQRFRFRTVVIDCTIIIIIIGSTALGGPWPPLEVS